ncbi:MAG: hypothetical protein AAFZ15_07880 [Bacteroidota bacterium]
MSISNFLKASPVFFFLFLFNDNVFAQTQLNRQHKFKDGIYLSAMDFRNDRPSIPPEDFTYEEKEINTQYAFQRELNNFKIVGAKKKMSRQDVKDEIWGICIDGIPYIHQRLFLLDNDATEPMGDQKMFKNYHVFTRITMIGHICTIAFEGYRKTNPVKEALMYTGDNSPYKNYKTKRKLLDLDTGELMNFNVGNLMACIEDDLQLYTDFKKDKKKKKKMDEYIIMYNRRNPIYLK